MQSKIIDWLETGLDPVQYGTEDGNGIVGRVKVDADSAVGFGSLAAVEAEVGRCLRSCKCIVTAVAVWYLLYKGIPSRPTLLPLTSSLPLRTCFRAEAPLSLVKAKAFCRLMDIV